MLASVRAKVADSKTWTEMHLSTLSQQKRWQTYLKRDVSCRWMTEKFRSQFWFHTCLADSEPSRFTNRLFGQTYTRPSLVIHGLVRHSVSEIGRMLTRRQNQASPWRRRWLRRRFRRARLLDRILPHIGRLRRLSIRSPESARVYSLLLAFSDTNAPSLEKHPSLHGLPLRRRLFVQCSSSAVVLLSSRLYASTVGVLVH